MSARIECRDTLAVLLTGDDDSPEFRRARVHAATCPSCSAALDDAEAPERVLDHVRVPALTITKAALAVLSLGQLALAVPWVFGANPVAFMGHADGEHLARDGALGVLLAVAGLITARRPAYARAMAYVCLAVVALHVFAGVVDTEDHAVAFPFEASHVLVLAIAALVVGVAAARLPKLSRRPRAVRLLSTRPTVDPRGGH